MHLTLNYYKTMNWHARNNFSTQHSHQKAGTYWLWAIIIPPTIIYIHNHVCACLVNHCRQYVLYTLLTHTQWVYREISQTMSRMVEPLQAALDEAIKAQQSLQLEVAQLALKIEDEKEEHSNHVKEVSQ